MKSRNPTRRTRLTDLFQTSSKSIMTHFFIPQFSINLLGQRGKIWSWRRPIVMRSRNSTSTEGHARKSRWWWQPSAMTGLTASKVGVWANKTIFQRTSHQTTLTFESEDRCWPGVQKLKKCVYSWMLCQASARTTESETLVYSSALRLGGKSEHSTYPVFKKAENLDKKNSAPPLFLHPKKAENL